ncbi:MAG: ABC transporter permease [Candidatus Doudnabacteria bacterium]|nr:ABC transporter permease [Candidatus Doudnabacteria bacterium]
MPSFFQLFIANLKIIYRNRSGVFWTLAVPLGIYVALAALPLPKTGEGLLYKNFALPGVIAYVIMQAGIYTLAYWMVDLKGRGVIKRFLATPIKTSHLVSALILARLSVIVAQATLITFVGLVFFEAAFMGNILSTLILIILGGGIFLCIGLLISHFSNSYETAAPLTASLGMPMAFLGNLFFPVELLPNTLQIVSKILPITYLAEGLRQAYLYPFNFESISKSILVLTIWLGCLLALTIKIFKLKE